MSDVIACPSCGTSNSATADWCNLCFARFERPAQGEPAQGASDSPPAEAWPLDVMADLARAIDGGLSDDRPDAGSADGASPAGLGRTPGDPSANGVGASKTWTCRFCGTEVAIEAAVCPACHQSIFDSFGAQVEVAAELDPTVALRWSALPGGGHMKLGQGILGMAIGLAVTISMLFGLTVVASGQALYGVGLVFIGLGTWLASAHDVFRISNNQTDQVLLKPRVISVIAGVMFMVIVGAAVSAQPVIDQTTPGL